jgi:hypothetical protein
MLNGECLGRSRGPPSSSYPQASRNLRPIAYNGAMRVSAPSPGGRPAHAMSLRRCVKLEVLGVRVVCTGGEDNHERGQQLPVHAT